MISDAAVIFSACLILVSMGTHLLMRSFFTRHASRIYLANVLAVILFASVMTALQYLAWEGTPVTRALLPPAQPLWYFAQFVLFRIWAPFVISFAASLLGMWAMRRVNEKKGGVLLHEDEPPLAGSAIFLSGFPGVVIYLPVFLALFVAATAIQTARKGMDHRVSPYFLWLPAALCVILTIYFLIRDWDIWRTLAL